MKDLCCDCVDSTTYYPNGVKPADHIEVENLWKQGQEAYAAAKAALADFNTAAIPRKRATIRSHYEEAEQAYNRSWALIAELQAQSGTTMCYPNISSSTRDACGVCGGDLSSCLGCTAVALPTPIGPLNGTYEDDCGLCNGESAVDSCGVCVNYGGTNSADCLGCDGVAASGKVLDACYNSSDPRMFKTDGVTPRFALGEVGSGCSDPVAFKAACDAGGGGCCGCDGVPDSTKTFDACGTCLDQNDASRVTDESLCSSIFLVKLSNGVTIGPYTKDEIKTGSLTYTEASTLEQVTYKVQSDSLIARAKIENQTSAVQYGNTSVYQEYVDTWRSIYVDGRDDVINATTGPDSTNIVFVTAVRVINTSDFVELQKNEEFSGVIYPSCTGSSYRASDGHRLHGKKTGANYFGIITTNGMPEDWTLARGLRDTTYNPESQYVYDVVETWADQICTCQPGWLLYPEPIPPTCERVWVQPNEDERKAVMQRSAAKGSWTVSGGWWVQDYGQKTPETQLTARGPKRIDSFGYLSSTSSRSGTQETDELGACDYESIRIINDSQNATGAVWYPVRQKVANGFDVNFTFMITQPSVVCESVDVVSGAFTQMLHNKFYETCKIMGGDGFAFVIRDDVATLTSSSLPTLGKGGPSLGYSGLTNSIAFEFDTVYTAEFNEPRESHVAIHSRGKAANTAHGSASLAAVALDGGVATTSVNDGKLHKVRITYTANVTVDEIFFKLEAGEIALSAALGSQSVDSLGVLSLYLDDLAIPLMSVPFSMESILRDSSTDAWVGFTASSGELWQAVDVIDWTMSSTP